MGRKNVKRIIDEMNLMDDYFMVMVFNDNIPAVELVLNVIMNTERIKIQKLQVQKTVKNPKTYGRSIVFDVNAKDTNKNLYDIEFQKYKAGSGRKRSRYYSGMLDLGMLKTRQKFSELKDSYVIFITETDVIKKGFPIYHIERSILETKESFNDGNHVIYVNGEYENDETPIGKLIHDFKCKKADEMYYKELRDAVKYFKEDKGGLEKMCKAMDDYLREGWKNGFKSGRRDGIKIGRKDGIEIGRKDGIKIGRERGLITERKKTARNMKAMGFDAEIIGKVIGVSAETVEKWVGTMI